MQKTEKHLAGKLFSTTPAIADDDGRTHAAVATVLCKIEDQPHVLFIQRSESPHDPWSGQIAFPGGRIDPEDCDLQDTAVRETFEEVGLDLVNARYLGCLPPLATFNQLVMISTFVYVIGQVPKLILDPLEVADTHWIPINVLNDNNRMVTHEHHGASYPGVDILNGRPVLWGLTLKICQSLFSDLC